MTSLRNQQSWTENPDFLFHEKITSLLFKPYLLSVLVITDKHNPNATSTLVSLYNVILFIYFLTFIWITIILFTNFTNK